MEFISLTLPNDRCVTVKTERRVSDLTQYSDDEDSLNGEEEAAKAFRQKVRAASIVEGDAEDEDTQPGRVSPKQQPSSNDDNDYCFYEVNEDQCDRYAGSHNDLHCHGEAKDVKTKEVDGVFTMGEGLIR